ncbi:undecaprenyl-phosphate glucose phosphotransferase [Acaryochloris sp. IP29b_bin.148]|uniref:undecaprenyl-phosphate glucose phosphotransferase n=1 Tax=Acaryochloris sp. IP29b_bin.148 TaxID=2969218 RepID=UPI002608089C|nr:undecaprenyl-phosphate glucose phosphotransferase [Acaryochloris sp. IP29b_bin.148]
MSHNTHWTLRANMSIVTLAQRLLDPTVAVLLLVVLAHFYNVTFATSLQLFALTTFLLILPIFKATGMYRPYRSLAPRLLMIRLIMGWSIVMGMMLFIGFVTKTSMVFSRALILTWSCSVPIVLLAVHFLVWNLLRQLRVSGRNSKFAVIAGVNKVSLDLAEQIRECRDLGIRLRGFFDDTSPSDLPDIPVMGTLAEVPEYVRQNQIDVVYVACTSDNEPRFTELIEALQDTTACVYFVPSLLMYSLMHGRSYEINGVPLISIWEIPFSDLQYFFKRAIDIVLSGLALVALSPVMAVIAIAVKLSSPGPILFKQRRYGLNGQEIIVYKFRSMTVMEDGGAVVQATRGDRRITPVGAFLRKTSLDELPQFLNVWQGRMSLVGPRPHAVAHNEMYRKLISGYMLRHKVKPGITGWAQVNGCRGETETLDKMKRRIDYDLEYLKNWSLSLDIQILLKTAFVFLRDQNAY